MDCNEINDMLSLYVDNELDENQKQLVEKHIEQCDECKKELKKYKNMILMLQNMPQKEPPKGYCKRLHEKLSNVELPKKVNKKIRFLKYVSIAAVLVLIFAIYTVSDININRSLPQKSNDAYDYDTSMSGNQESANNADMNEIGFGSNQIEDEKFLKRDISSENRNGSAMMSVSSANEEKELKIVKTGNISAQIKNYDTFFEELISKVNALGGYVEQNNTNIYQTHEDIELKHGYLKLRVPQDNFYELIKYIEEASKVEQKNINESDLTKDYYDKDNQVKNLEIQEQKLRDLFDKAQTVQDMIQIENELRRIRTEIDSLNMSLRDIDDRVSMSSIELNLDEVMETNLKLSDRDSIWNKAREGFINSINKMIGIGEDLIIYVVTILPLLLLLIVILVIIFVIHRKIRRNKK